VAQQITAITDDEPIALGRWPAGGGLGAGDLQAGLENGVADGGRCCGSGAVDGLVDDDRRAFGGDGGPDGDVGDDASAADGVAAGREPLGRRHADADVADGEREDALDGAFAVTLFADDRAAAMVANGTRENFAGAG